MADPHVKQILDNVDKATIITYRLGLLITGLALSLLALQQIFYPYWFKQIVVIIALGCLLQASSLHIYDKQIRWLLVNATWVGCWLTAVSLITTGLWVAYVSLGAFMITLSGLAYKESRCFSLPLLKVIPVLLVISWLLIIFSLNHWAASILLIVSALYLYMLWCKINMPLHYDLGDRKKYEI